MNTPSTPQQERKERTLRYLQQKIRQRTPNNIQVKIITGRIQ